MATPKDKQRSAAARLWIATVGGIPRAAEISGVSARTLERMKAGTRPPPPKLLEEMAASLDAMQGNRALLDPISNELRAAAQPAGGQADA